MPYSWHLPHFVCFVSAVYPDNSIEIEPPPPPVINLDLSNHHKLHRPIPVHMSPLRETQLSEQDEVNGNTFEEVNRNYVSEESHLYQNGSRTTSTFQAFGGYCLPVYFHYMCMCMYVCMYVYIHTYMCMYMYMLYVYVYMYMYMYMYICSVYVYVCVYVYM